MIPKNVAVCSRTFSRNLQLRQEIQSIYDEVKFNDEGLNLKGQSLIDFLQGFEGAIVALEKIDDEVLDHLPDLKVIGKYGVGVNNIDFTALHRHGVRFGWQKGVNKRSVAELALGMMLSLLRSIVASTTDLRSGSWKQVIGRELSQLTVGVIGCGHVGKELVHLLKPFGVRIIVHDIVMDQSFVLSNKLEVVSKDVLIKESDIITLHVPYNQTTRYIIGKAELELMKSDSILVNTARGGLIDEEALFQILSDGKLSGVALDVFEVEPVLKCKLLEHPKVISTPHIGGSTETSILAMGRAAIRGLQHHEEANSFLGME